MKRYIFLLLIILCSMDCYSQTDSVRASIERQVRQFPRSHLQDIYKSFYQSWFGAEHLITDTASVRDYLHREIAEAAVDSVPNPYFEPVGANNQYVRVYLRCVSEGLITEQQLFDAFIRSSVPENRVESWTDLWKEIIVPYARSAGVHFSQEEYDALLNASGQNRAVRHSEEYRNSYHPRYRIVDRKIFDLEILPVVNKR